MKRLFADLAYAFRGWIAQPTLLSVAATSLALGIGVNVAIFSIYQQVVMRPLPVPDAHQLVNLASPGPRPGSTSNNFTGPRDEIFSYPMMRDLRAQPDGFRAIAAQRLVSTNLSIDGNTQAAQGLLVSGNYFETLQLKPSLGRLLTDADDATPGQSPVAVLSHRYWREALGGNPDVLGRVLTVNGESLNVVGVAPVGFDGSTPGSFVSVFVPIGLHWRLEPRPIDADDRSNYWVYLFGRLADGVSMEQASTALNLRYRRLITEIELPQLQDVDSTTRSQFAQRQLQLADGSRGQSFLASNAGPAVIMLWAVSALVLLIACLNIANILLARGSARAAELSVRASIGASPGRIRRQLLSEAAALGLIGLLLSIPVAFIVLKAIPALLPAVAQIEVSGGLDLRALSFAAAIAIATVLACGMLPAWQLARAAPINALRGSGSRTVGRVVTRVLNALATAQVALSMAVLVMAGLFTQSLVKLSQIDPGFAVDSIASFSIAPRRNGYTTERAAEVYARFETALREQPGISSVSTSMVPLLGGADWGRQVTVEGFQTGPSVDIHSFMNIVGEDFFQTMQVPIQRGRAFEAGDRQGAPKVAIVNRAFADKFGLGDAPVGKRIRIGEGTDLDTEIVGLVPNFAYNTLRERTQEQFFLPRAQSPGASQMTFYLRGAIDADALLKKIAVLAAQIDPQLPVEDLQTLRQTVHDSTATQRLMSLLASAFAVLATALAALGLYGVVSFSLAQRTQELGLRLALGAQPRSLRNMVLRQTGKMAAIGAVIGLVLAVASGTAVQSMLFGTRAHDPTILAVAAALLAGVAMLAAAVPARRASVIDPMVALRND